MRIINAALGKAGAQSLLMPILVRRPSSNVQADSLKGDGASLSALSNRRTHREFRRKGSDGMKLEDALSRYATVDPLPQLVESRFRLLTECGSGNDQKDKQANNRSVAQLRARRLDDRIVTTVATSAEGLLAQLRLLALFYDESLNGAGRRGSLLIQTIAAGIEQIDSSS